MHVTVNCYGAARAATGRKSVDVAFDGDASVGDALDRLAERFPDFEDALNPDLVVMRDGTHVERGTGLSDDDVLSVSNPPMVEE